MMALCADRYQQWVVNAEAQPSGAQRSLALTTPPLTPYPAVETRSVLLSIAELGAIELVFVVCQENASQLATRRGTKEVALG